MTERRRPIDTDLERLLAEYATDITFPPFADIATSVEQRLAVSRQSRLVDETDAVHPAAPARHDEALPTSNGSSPYLLDTSRPAQRRRQMLELAAGLIIFALLAGALALVFRGFEPGSSETPIGSTAVPASELTVEPTLEDVPLPSNVSHLIRVDTTPDGTGLQMLPVDPSTLDPLPGYEPISLGHHYTHAFSPDGRTMAALIWPIESGGWGEGGKLYLIDLADWTTGATDVEIDENTSHLLFSEDGRTLYWTLPTTTHPAHNMPRDYTLYRLDLETGTQATVVAFPESFPPVELRLLDGGARLAIWGVPTDPNNRAEGPPRVVIVDLEHEEIVTDVELPGVKAWQYQEITGGSVSYRIYQPGLAWDLERGLLYVVHADEERITVVDLEAGVVMVQSDISKPRSLFDRFADWLVPSATAAAVPWTSKLVALSEDGSRLYVAGTHDELTEDENGEYVRANDTELVIVDTERLEETDRLDLGTIVGMQLTRDGRHLIVRSYENPAYTTGHVLTKIELTTGEIVGQLDLPNLRSNGLAVSDELTAIRVYRGAGETARFEEIIIDLASFEIVNQREMSATGNREYLHP